MSVRILLRVFPRQSPSSTIRFEMSSDADWLASDCFLLLGSDARGVAHTSEATIKMTSTTSTMSRSTSVFAD